MPPRRTALVALPQVAFNSLRIVVRDDYLEVIGERGRNRSPRTIQSYEEALTQLADFLEDAGHPATIETVTPKDIAAFLGALRTKKDRYGRERSDATVANRFRSLRAFFAWAATQPDPGLLDVSPMAGMKAPKFVDRVPDVLTSDEIRRLLKASDGPGFSAHRDNAMITLFTNTGLRLNELANLQVRDVDFEQRTILVRVAKGGRQRVIPFQPRTLTRYMRDRDKHHSRDEPWLWLGVRGRLQRAGVIRALDRRAAEAGIRNWHVHRLRHSFAHYDRLAGNDPNNTAYVGGWAPGSTSLARYGSSAQGERARRAAVSIADLIARGELES